MTTADEGRIESERLDPAIVAALYVDHADELRAFLAGVLRNGDLAAEALQATFVRAMEAGHTSNGETRKGWLFRVAFNEAMQLKRRQKSHESSLKRKVSKTPVDAGEESPADSAVRWETVERIKTALEKLPEEQRRVVRMRIYEEKTFAVIAEELNAPLGTVLTRMRLALKKLADTLGPEEPV